MRACVKIIIRKKIHGGVVWWYKGWIGVGDSDTGVCGVSGGGSDGGNGEVALKNDRM